MADINFLETAKIEAEALFSKLGVQAKVEASESEDGIELSIDAGEDNALLIGKHGNTLSSLESIIALIVAKKTGEYKRVLIEIGGYREEREKYLTDLAIRLKEDVVASGYEKSVRGLKPWERRLIHMTLAEDTDVVTESTGEDRDRVLVIKKK